jgi:hypothetical protein
MMGRWGEIVGVIEGRLLEKWLGRFFSNILTISFYEFERTEIEFDDI